MNKNSSYLNEYLLPFKIKSNFKWTTHLLFGFLSIGLGLILLVPSEKDTILRLFKLLFFIFDIYIIYCWIYVGILKKLYIEIKTLFGVKKIEWSKVYTV